MDAHKVSVLALLAMLLLQRQQGLSAQDFVVHVDQDNGNDDANCLNSTKAQPCESLAFAVENVPNITNKSVEIKISSPELILGTVLLFEGFSDLTISGASSATEAVIHCQGNNTGFSFIQVQNLTIEYVVIEGCGALQKSTSIDRSNKNETEWLRSSLYLLECTHVSILNVTVKETDGKGVYIYDTNGIVRIEDCVFEGNSVMIPSVGGGGLHIEFTKCSPGLAKNCSGPGTHNRDSVYTLRNCSFLNNFACGRESSAKFVSPFVDGIIPRVGRGGGLYLALSSDASNNRFAISGCSFVNNSATFGSSGALIQLHNSAHNNIIQINDSNFDGNSVIKRDGGGLGIGFMMYKLSEIDNILPENNSFLCKNCTFSRNIAALGGGTSLFVTKEIGYGPTITIEFKDCTWTENKAQFGAALYISPGIWDYSESGLFPIPVFTDSTFESNSIQNCHQSLTNGISKAFSSFGTVFISTVRAIFRDRSDFFNNSGSAVYLSGGVLEFSNDSMVNFNGNSGYNGGAIALYTSATLYINNNSSFCFINNMASLDGGALYSNTFLPQISYRNCFIQPASPEQVFTNSSFFFSGNVAQSNNGHSIFASSFKPCRIFCDNFKTRNPLDILGCVGNFIFDNTSRETDIVTAPAGFSVDENKHLLSIIPGKEQSLLFSVVPGKEEQLPIKVLDESNHSLSGIVYNATIESNSNIRMDCAFTQVSNNKVNILGAVGENGTLVLSTQYVSLRMSIRLTRCPPGYIHVEGSRKCECAADEYFGILTCNPQVSIRHGFWMGPCDSSNEDKLCTAYCPYGFCSYNGSQGGTPDHALPCDQTQLDSSICGPERTGRVCSQCASNRSVYFHSWKYRCGPETLCPFGWIFYILSEIIPLTLCFIGIIVFNISFAKGNINGFILSAQIIDALSTNANGLIEFPQYITVLRSISNFFYRFFNLDFFSSETLSFCLWKGANVMDALIMKYVTVAFALILVLLTIFISSGRCGRFCYRIKFFRRYCYHTKFYTPKSVIIHGLSAFFVLCYSQCARVSFQILNSFCLFSTNFGCPRSYVYRAGYLDYLGADHWKYAWFAILVLIFIVIVPPLLLIIYPLVFNFLGKWNMSESKLAAVLWRIMPIQLLDSFQSSFKDRFRFFAGLYFLYRALVLALYAYCHTMQQFYTLVGIQLIVALVLHAIFQPYKKRKHNIIDSVLISNLAIINGITLYNYAEGTNGEKQKNALVNFIEAASIIQTIFIFLPLIYLTCLVLRWVGTKIKKWKNTQSDNEDQENLPKLRSISDGSDYNKW